MVAWSNLGCVPGHNAVFGRVMARLTHCSPWHSHHQYGATQQKRLLYVVFVDF
jgi:hypothetical protein